MTTFQRKCNRQCHRVITSSKPVSLSQKQGFVLGEFSINAPCLIVLPAEPRRISAINPSKHGGQFHELAANTVTRLLQQSASTIPKTHTMVLLQGVMEKLWTGQLTSYFLRRPRWQQTFPGSQSFHMETAGGTCDILPSLLVQITADDF